MGGSAETAFACPTYGPANRCGPTPSAAPGCGGVANMQPGATNVRARAAPERSVNRVLPYSTDDNDPNLPDDTGHVPAATGGIGGFTPAQPHP